MNNRDKLFSRACCDRKRSNGFKLKEDRFRLEIRKRFFTVRVGKQRHRLPKEILDAPSLEIFQVRLDGVPHLFEGNPAHCREIGLDGL